MAKSVAKFEKSSKNFLRSVSVLYKGGILSKRKYCNIRSSEIFDYDSPAKKRKRTEFEEGCRLPALVPYKQLMKFIFKQNPFKQNSRSRWHQCPCAERSSTSNILKSRAYL